MSFDEIESRYREFVLENFDIESCMQFMRLHCVEIYRLPDWQYACEIDGRVYDVDIDFFTVLLNGINNFKKQNQIQENETTS